MSVLANLFLVLAFINASLAYIITVDSHAEECFFDTAPAGSKLGKFPFYFFPIFSVNGKVYLLSTCSRSYV